MAPSQWRRTWTGRQGAFKSCPPCLTFKKQNKEKRGTQLLHWRVCRLKRQQLQTCVWIESIHACPSSSIFVLHVLSAADIWRLREVSGQGMLGLEHCSANDEKPFCTFNIQTCVITHPCARALTQIHSIHPPYSPYLHIEPTAALLFVSCPFCMPFSLTSTSRQAVCVRRYAPQSLVQITVHGKYCRETMPLCVFVVALYVNKLGESLIGVC